MLGVALSNAGSQATTLATDLSVEGGASISNFSTHRGLATREDSIGGSLALSTAVGGGDLSFGASLFDTDGGGEMDFGASYSLGVDLFGQNIGLTAALKDTESIFGDREELSLTASYTYIADLSVGVWYEDNNDLFGVELGVSYDFKTPVENLTLSPFVTVNFAEEYEALELGVKADYVLTEDVSIIGKVSFNNNTFEGSSFEVDEEWVVGAGLSYKF
tara:strand:- start:406 stop:1059 length:654 start_codon:yes stop_codon:yes gene_type:complete